MDSYNALTKKRLLEKTIQNGDCLLFNKTYIGQKYGSIWYKGNQERAHRVSWMLENGPIPKGFVVMHICDVPQCVNPKHLTIGTQHQNIMDCIAKRRQKQRCGEYSPKSKLTWDLVAKIKELLHQNVACAEVARMFGTDKTTISNIKNGKTWKDQNLAHKFATSDEKREMLRLFPELKLEIDVNGSTVFKNKTCLSYIPVKSCCV
jgi:HNH endonuclease